MNERIVPNKQEQAPVRIEIAKPENWQAYKELRLLAITGKDREMFGAASDPKKVEEERTRPDVGWQDDLSRLDRFVVLAWEGPNPVGMVRAIEYNIKDTWYLNSGYTREDLRGKVFPPKFFTEVVDEVKRRGGTKVLMSVKAHNDKMIRLASLLGFKKVEEGSSEQGFDMELDLKDKK